VAATDADAGTPSEEPAAKKSSRAGRDLPAAIAVGVGIGSVLIATLVFYPRGWVVLCAGAILVASHEVVRRLREAEYIIPVVPLLVGGQVTCWLTWPYAFGVLFGKHPVVPAISPKKSWEGFGGSLLCGITATFLTATFMVHRPPWEGVLLGVVLVVTCALGDLVESQVKRDLGIKDMGRLLPGHGGLMDRLDSVLPAAVVAWTVFALLPA
jgi:CDP-diglyceride synthetase